MSSRPPVAIGPDLRAALVAMIRRRVPESEVEDIVQSTLADALASPNAPADSDSLRRWIFGIAKNKVVDYHRRAGRETFEMPEVAGKPAPHAEADLLRWAERHLPPGDESKTTLDWMLREGEGEKLEWIAETERLPATRVRQRVSRLRRHLKSHWQREVALLATFGVLLTVLALALRRRDPEGIANEDAPRAAELRRQALDKCAEAAWRECVDGLDAAKQLDAAGDDRPEVRRAREQAREALTPPPPESKRDDAPPPPPSAEPAPTAAPTTAPTPVPPPRAAPTPTPAPPAPPAPREPSTTKTAIPAPKNASKSVTSWPDPTDEAAPKPAPPPKSAPPASTEAPPLRKK